MTDKYTKEMSKIIDKSKENGFELVHPTIFSLDENHRSGGYYVNMDGGMTKDEYIATKILQGLVSSPNRNKNSDEIVDTTIHLKNKLLLKLEIEKK